MSYISDLLGRCKLQKALLHTLLASVYDARQKSASMCCDVRVIVVVLVVVEAAAVVVVVVVAVIAVGLVMVTITL